MTKRRFGIHEVVQQVDSKRQRFGLASISELAPSTLVYSHSRRNSSRTNDINVEEVAEPSIEDSSTISSSDLVEEPNTNDFDTMLESMQNTMKRVTTDADTKRNLYTRANLSSDLLRDVRRCGGDQRLDAIRRTLNSLGYTRSQYQRLFHDKFIQACLPIIYAEDWETCAERVMAEMNLTRICAEVLVQTPRRFGKTVSVAMFVLAMLLNVPGIRICIFSTGKRASSGLMTEIMDRLQNIDGGRDRIVKSNQEQLFLSTVALAAGQSQNGEKAKKMINEVTTSRCFSFPAGTASKSHTMKT